MVDCKRRRRTAETHSNSVLSTHAFPVGRLYFYCILHIEMSATASKCRNEAICPFCALLCDDITVELDSANHSFEVNGCRIAQARYSGIVNPSHDKCDVDGYSVDLAEAIQTAAEMISKSKALVITGMYTDVAGSRAALKLAERKFAVIMQCDGEGNHSQVSRIQRSGGYFTTLSEIRNRADLIVMFGRGPVSECPRILNMLQSQHVGDDGSTRKVSFVAVGTGDNCGPKGSMSFKCNREQYGMLADAIRLRVQKKRRTTNPGFISDEQINRLTEMIAKANYPVFIWSESDFNFPLGDIAIDSINQLIETLNVKSRCAGLAVSGSASRPTVNQVATWQFGKPLPLSFRTGEPDYFPQYHSFESLQRRHDVDLVLWVGGLDDQTQFPESNADVIAISHTRPSKSQLFIPVGIPGVHHDGHLFRTDQVVAMHVQRSVHSLLPSAADVLTSILSELESGQC